MGCNVYSFKNIDSTNVLLKNNGSTDGLKGVLARFDKTVVYLRFFLK